MVARTDTSFMMHTIPHIVKMCNYPFEEKVLAVDTAEVSGHYAKRPNIGTMNQLRKNCRALVKNGVMDRIADIDYSESCRKKTYKKHLGSSHIWQTHNFKGYPVLGSMFCIEECTTEHMVHFDSDMLLYQRNSCNWIDEGIQLLKKKRKLLFARAGAGPGTSNKWKRIDWFGSRCYLLNKNRFDEFLPVKPVFWFKPRRIIKSKLPVWMQNLLSKYTKLGFLDSWEKMISAAIKEKGYYSAYFNPKDSWTLHVKQHNSEVIKILSEIIKKVESGKYPKEQAGFYDLHPECWKKYLKK
jgi:hypothetical protein